MLDDIANLPGSEWANSFVILETKFPRSNPDGATPRPEDESGDRELKPTHSTGLVREDEV